VSDVKCRDGKRRSKGIRRQPHANSLSAHAWIAYAVARAGFFWTSIGKNYTRIVRGADANRGVQRSDACGTLSSEVR